MRVTPAPREPDAPLIVDSYAVGPRAKILQPKRPMQVQDLPCDFGATNGSRASPPPYLGRSSKSPIRTPPSDLFAIPRTALLMTGLFSGGERLEEVFGRLGGGLEIRTKVNPPMGSGLGTSGILAASTVRAVGEMTGESFSEHVLSDRVMRLEQLMTTGGGWQDQAGGIFPGAKLVSSGPGLHQRLRAQPVEWSDDRSREFEGLLVLCYTGILSEGPGRGSNHFFQSGSFKAFISIRRGRGTMMVENPKSLCYRQPEFQGCDITSVRDSKFEGDE